MPQPAPAEMLELLNKVRAWPASARIELIQALLTSLHADLKSEAAQPRSGGLLELRGIAAGGGPPLDDEAVDRLRYEALIEKYGR